jgi:predicted  nucleic acid-binding Zn-ribbon protein
MALGVVPGDLDSAAKAFTDPKTELDKEKAAWEIAQTEVNTLSRAVKDLKISTDKFAAQIPILKEKVKHIENKVVYGLNEVRAQELYLERTTIANDNYKKENAQLTEKLESKFPWPFKTLFPF